jgi:DNA helicase HerA-like ATPase
MDAGHTTRFARVDFRNDDRVFGIKDEDRFLHVYVIGKTGTGKSTLIETMALQDLERGKGFALIDPHGDLVARVAARIPAPDLVVSTPVFARSASSRSAWVLSR